MSKPTIAALTDLLDKTLQGDHPHIERITVASAVISEVLRRNGMEATLVGGGAIEFHASDVYTTNDIDLVVEGKSRDDLDAALTEIGFSRHGRHWKRGELFVEVPGNWMSDPVDVFPVGSLSLRVVRREVVLADRIIGFKHWRATAYGAQAVALIALFGPSLDEAWLRHRLNAEGAEDALDALRELAAENVVVSEKRLQDTLERLHRQSDA